jgi:hypothetical protein
MAPAIEHAVTPDVREEPTHGLEDLVPKLQWDACPKEDGRGMRVTRTENAEGAAWRGLEAPPGLGPISLP